MQREDNRKLPIMMPVLARLPQTENWYLLARDDVFQKKGFIVFVL